VTAIPEQVDGATIKILIDGNGRTPMPPESAYQQVIKGLPAVDYTLQELIYAPRNLRSYRFYGMSPVEQVLGIANIALKRQLHLMNYYTDGTVPDAILTPPETWNPDQIKQAQLWLDTLTSPTARHKVRILPGGQFTQLRDPKLKDELDDWLARIICYCFSLAPGALVKDMTKATGDTNKTSAQEEGLEPLKLWWKDVMDEILVRCYAAEDLEFAYHEKEISDPQVKMMVWTGYKAAGIVTADEVRDKALGLDPMSEEQKAEVAPPPPVGLVAPGKPGTNGKPGTTQGEVDGSASPLPPASKKPTEKHAHAGGIQKKKTKVLKPINHDRALVTKAAAKVAKLFRSRFAKQRKDLVAAVRAEATKLLKMSQDDFLDLWDELSDDGRDKLREALAEELSKVAVDGGSQGLTQVLDFVSADTAADLEAMLAQVNEQAVAFAEERAAELVGMKWSEDAGAWIVNPNAEWAIDDTTRSRIQTLTTQAEQEGWSNDKLADALQDDTGFSDDRAEMIARTETAFADIQGNLAGWEASGVVEAKEWSVSQDEVCDDCLALDGKIVGLDEDFPEGDPPLHPRCRCDLLPVVMTQAGIDAATAGGGTDAAE
jgi:SPP1 gp7 family putative phage head morphogenesis protein